MSNLLIKSTSKNYKRYFEQLEVLRGEYATYSLKRQAASNDSLIQFSDWEKGRAGVPLAWMNQSSTVLVDHTDAHTLVIGPTGSKKSRLVVMPQVRILASRKESMIISDPKAEIYNRTAHYLSSQGYQVYAINLRDPSSGHGWNPLEIPYRLYCNGEIDKAYEFSNDIALNLCKVAHTDKDPFWANSAASLFFGLTLLLFKYCKEFKKDSRYVHVGNIIQLRNVLLSGPNGKPSPQMWNYAKTDPLLASALIGTVEAPNETRASILSTFDQSVRTFSIQPNLLGMLAKSEIDLDRVGIAPTAIFLILPDEKTGYHNLASLFIKQSYEYIIFKAQQRDDQHATVLGCLYNRLNYVLDEFSSLPTIHDFPSMITASRSRNIRFTLVIQSKHQLMQRYQEESETIQTNCGNWIFLTSREIKLLEELSVLCGQTVDNPPKPVVPIAALQRLDKEQGEALLLLGRYKPFITRLADIDCYDDGNFQHLQLQLDMRATMDYLAFDLPTLEPEKEVSTKSLFNRKNPHPLENMDIDEMLADIDRKIKEYEENEAKEKISIESDAHTDEKGADTQ